MATVTTKPSLTIKRRFNAPPAKVFAAWTDPEKLKHWMGGREIGSVTAEADVRVGGRFRIVMQKSSDGEQHDVSGVYREVIAERETGVHLGLEEHARTRIDRDDHVQGRQRRHADDVHRTSSSSTKTRAIATSTAGTVRSRSWKSISLLSDGSRRCHTNGHTDISTGTS